MASQCRLMLDQLQVMVHKDFKLKYNSTALGFLWSVLTPTAQSLVYYFVFKVVMRFQVENYLLYLLSGIFLWQFFCNTIMMSGGVFASNAGLMKKTAFNRLLLPVTTLLVESIHFLLTIPILVIVMICSGILPTWSLLTLPLVLFNLWLFTFGLSLLYASYNIYLRDLERIVTILLQIWMFLSPVFIPLNTVPEKYQFLFRCNPMTSLLSSWRAIFFDPAWRGMDLLISFGFGTVMLLIGLLAYRKREPGFAEMM